MAEEGNKTVNFASTESESDRRDEEKMLFEVGGIGALKRKVKRDIEEG